MFQRDGCTNQLCDSCKLKVELSDCADWGGEGCAYRVLMEAEGSAFSAPFAEAGGVVDRWVLVASPFDE